MRCKEDQVRDEGVREWQEGLGIRYDDSGMA